MTEECDLLAVGRPARQISDHRRKNELKFLTAVHFASPQRAVGPVVIRHPLPVLREINTHRRNSAQIRDELRGSRVLANQFAARLPTLYEDPLAIDAGH